MKPKPFSFIQKPCEVGWDNMHPAEGGRHCDFCKKKVHDLTQMGYAQQRDYIRTQGGEICGHMHPWSLRAAIRTRTKSVSQKLKVFVLALLAAFGFLTGLPGQATAQPASSISQSILSASIQGNFLDSYNYQISGAKIQLFQDEELVQETTSDTNGRFEFPNLEPGVYTLVGVLDFEEVKMDPIEIEPGETVDIVLVSTLEPDILIDGLIIDEDW